MTDAAGTDRGRYLSPTRAELSGDRAELYDAIVGGPRGAQSAVIPVVDEEGRLLGPFGLMAIAPALGSAVQELGAAVRFRGAFTTANRELAILAVAAHHRCDFEWFAHADAARAAGVDDAQLEAIRAGAPPTGLDETATAIWAATRALLTGGALDQQGYREAVSVLGEEGLIELVWLCGYYSMLALALAAFDPELPEQARGAFSV